MLRLFLVKIVCPKLERCPHLRGVILYIHTMVMVSSLDNFSVVISYSTKVAISKVATIHLCKMKNFDSVEIQA